MTTIFPPRITKLLYNAPGLFSQWNTCWTKRKSQVVLSVLCYYKNSLPVTVYHWNGPGNSVSYVLCGIVCYGRSSETPTELVHAICITHYGQSANYMRYTVDNIYQILLSNSRSATKQQTALPIMTKH